jgi:transcriptional regulator with XRE-family HTH domain
MMHRYTLDQVVARNLRRLREGRRWSRRALAEKLTMASDHEWATSRIIDLEGGRTGKPPASVQWRELVTLCLVFGVELWDVVLPESGELVITAGGKKDGSGQFVGNRHVLDAFHLAEILSGMPAEVFASEEQRAVARTMLAKENLDMAFIEAKQRELDELRSKYAVKSRPEIGPTEETIERSQEDGGGY